MNNDSSTFDSIIQFNNECDGDIGKLIKFSEDDQENKNIQLFISSAVVLLGAKFESCVESLIDEYINKINLESNRENIPNELKYSSIYYKLCEYKEKINKNHFDCFSTNADFLEEFSEFVRTIMNNTSELRINSQFSYGKHGYKELCKLFKNIAIDIQHEKFDKFVEDGLYSGVAQEKSFKDEFNKFTNNRNIVIHQNECPNITGRDILNTIDIFKKFIKEIGIELNKRLQMMK